MAKKKKTTTKRSSRSKTTPRRKKVPVRNKPAPRAEPRRSKKTAGKNKTASKRKTAPKTTRRQPWARRISGPADSDVTSRSTTRGLGSEAGGQSGDTEGLSRAELADSESVEELLEEGQAFEAGIVGGVENAPDADKGGVRTRQVPEDDVPQEYLDED
jgi:hypothetical protein